MKFGIKIELVTGVTGVDHMITMYPSAIELEDREASVLCTRHELENLRDAVDQALSEVADVEVAFH